MCSQKVKDHQHAQKNYPMGVAEYFDEDAREWYGIDGEGKGRHYHRYTLLATSDEYRGEERWIENQEGLSTEQCLEFILDFPGPEKARIFAFSFNYDLTMMLRDLPAKALYRLFRPELRQPPANSKNHTLYPVLWKDYKLNLQGTCFKVSRLDWNEEKQKYTTKQRTIWDIFKFYQMKFTSALVEWKIGSKEQIEKIAAMKEQRGDFDKLSDTEIRNYCLSECSELAQLARKLVESHKAIGLKLNKFYGAGSSASCMLTLLDVKDKRGDVPEAMREPIAQGFFGGRFENSVIGSIEGAVWGYDISSAYPYQLAFLPCMIHGKWRLTSKEKDIQNSKTALVRYTLPRNEGMERAWGPLPFRTDDGNIVYPLSSGGGWVWRDEYLAAQRMCPWIGFVEAWVFEGGCDCPKPFEEIPRYYVRRLAIGKEGPGIVMKLGMNSVYGKLAQSVGKPQFQSWVWAGMITAGCRAQLLDLMNQHQDPWNVLAVATDGIYSREKIETSAPKDTGTFDALNDKGERADKPLGGWERKLVEKGAFFARPGIYFPNNPTDEELKAVRARGIGRAAMHETHGKMVEAWDNDQETIVVSSNKLVRFYGAKTAVSKTANGYRKLPTYGQWRKREIVTSLTPLPKRMRILKREGRHAKLQCFSFGENRISAPYDRGMINESIVEALMSTQEQIEQPEGGLVQW